MDVSLLLSLREARGNKTEGISHKRSDSLVYNHGPLLVSESGNNDTRYAHYYNRKGPERIIDRAFPFGHLDTPSSVNNPLCWGLYDYNTSLPLNLQHVSLLNKYISLSFIILSLVGRYSRL